MISAQVIQRSTQTERKGVGDAGTQECLGAAEVTKETGDIADQWAAKMAKKVAQEGRDVEREEVLVRLAAEVESAATPAGAVREGGKNQETVVLLPVEQQRRTTVWRPGVPYAGRQVVSRFVQEDEVAAQPRSGFFTQGQSRFFQRSMAASSRSNAVCQLYSGIGMRPRTSPRSSPVDSALPALSPRGMEKRHGCSSSAILIEAARGCLHNPNGYRTGCRATPNLPKWAGPARTCEAGALGE